MTGLDSLAAAARAVRHAPLLSTYRVQFHAGFSLRDAIGLVPYWHSLGVSHLYASPILKAHPGSTHGYDVVDHGRLNPEVGTPAEFDELSAALKSRGMGLLLDVVPNHMSVAGGNAWWDDVLEHGPASLFAGYFDIAWHDSPRPQMAGRLLLPVLGEQYGVALEEGKFRPVLEGGKFAVMYGGTRLPIDPRTYDRVLAPAAAALAQRVGAAHPAAVELASVTNAVTHLPPRSVVRPTRPASPWPATRAPPSSAASANWRNASLRRTPPSAPPSPGSRPPPGSMRWTSGSKRRRTGRASGGSPPTRSTTAASST